MSAGEDARGPVGVCGTGAAVVSVSGVPSSGQNRTLASSCFPRSNYTLLSATLLPHFPFYCHVFISHSHLVAT